MPLARGLRVFVVAASLGAGLAFAQDAAPVALELDPDFGKGGVVTLVGAGRLGIEDLRAMRVDGDRIYVAGSRRIVGETGGTRGFKPAVIRLLGSGRPDRTFGVRGTAAPRLRGDALDLCVDAEGNVVVVGEFRGSRRAQIGAVRLRPNGKIDRRWGQSGRVSRDVESGHIWTEVELADSSGAVLVKTFVSGGADRVIRIGSDGLRDARYGIAGAAELPGEPTAIAVDSQGRAYCRTDGFIRRLLADGRADPSFPLTLRGPTGAQVQLSTLGVDGADRIVGRGAESNVDTGVFRFLGDGTLDTSFADGGAERRLDDFPERNEFFHEVAAHSRGAGDRFAIGWEELRITSAKGSTHEKAIVATVAAGDSAQGAFGLHDLPTSATPGDVDRVVRAAEFSADGAALFLAGSTFNGLGFAERGFVARISLAPLE